MKKNIFSAIIIAIAMASCGNNDKAFDASGVFEATEVVVSAKVQGEIKALNAIEGQQVEQGQSLGLIDQTQLSLSKQQLEANRQSTDARILNLNNQVANIRQQIDNYNREKNRFETLLKSGAATQRQVDDIVYQISVLEKQLSATREQIAQANKGVEKQAQSIGSQISSVEEMLADAEIKSPLAGTVLQKYAEQGEYAMPGKALFKIANINTLRLRAYLDASQITTLKIGQKVKVYADQGSDERKEYEGTISWIADKAEFTPKTIQTRDERANLVYAVKIDVQNDGLIKIGMYGDVKL